MAMADCLVCEGAGYRSCDRCGGIVFDPVAGAVSDLCGSCVDLVLDVAGGMPEGWPWRRN
jgi:hypothetical protein